MLEVKGVDVKYGDLQVLWDVSFEVHAQEILAFIGANGAGKSTLLKTISALLTPARGVIAFNGRRIDKLAPHKIIRQGIVHVPEGRKLFPKMSVEENLITGALYGEAKTRRQGTLEEVYALFPRMKERRKQPAGTLSGGEQQMLSIGRGLMSLPKLMLLDEPSLGLAPSVIQVLFEMIVKISGAGVTILLVEQNVAQTLEMCHRACVLENGRIVMTGSGAELLENRQVKKAFLGR